MTPHDFPCLTLGTARPRGRTRAHRPPYQARLLTLLIGGLLVLPVSAQTATPASVERARAAETARAEREAERAQREASRDAERAKHAAARDAEREAMAAAREELRATQAELGRIAGRVAELTARLQREELDRVSALRLVMRPVLGVVLQGDPERGVRITAVSPNSAAAEAGLRAGDRIVAINESGLDSGSAEQRLDQGRNLLADLSVDKDVKLKIERGATGSTVRLRPRMLPGLSGPSPEALDQVALGERLQALVAPRWAYRIDDGGPVVLCPDGSDDCLRGALLDARNWRGVRLAALNPQLGRYFGSERGVLVLSNEGEVEGIEPGDVLLSVDGEAVDEPAEALRALRPRQDRGSHAVQLLRDRKRVTEQLDSVELSVLPLRLPDLPAPPAPPAPPGAPQPPPAPPAPAAVPVPRADGMSQWPATAPRAIAATPAPAPQARAVEAPQPGVLRQVLAD